MCGPTTKIELHFDVYFDAVLLLAGPPARRAGRRPLRPGPAEPAARVLGAPPRHVPPAGFAKLANFAHAPSLRSNEVLACRIHRGLFW